MNVLLWFFAFILVSVNAYGHLDKLCTDIYNRDACNNIERNQTYECADNIQSKTDCVLNIDEGKHQFAILEPEQAFLAANFVSDNVVVIGEVQAEKPPYSTVVIVRNFYNNSFENLRGKRYCHPGFKHDELVSKYVLNEFENRIIKLNFTHCNANFPTLLEKRLSALSSFFGDSCRPGPWTDDDDKLDSALKTKYSNLCQLCGPDKCNVAYQVPFNDALTCLRNGGDVAVTSLSEALALFNNTDSPQPYTYMCPNASTSSTPCTWTDQLNRLIITEKTVANDPKSYLEYHLPNHFSAFSTQALGSSVVITEALEKLLGLSKSDIISFSDPLPLKTYVSDRRPLPIVSNFTFCHQTVNWCTQNDQEQQKCLWLKQAALNSGLQPVIECVISSDNDTVSCLIDIQNGKADVAFADVTYGYIALKKGLTSVAYPETTTKDLAIVAIVVRENTTDIKSLSDLKGRGACLPQYGGREWLAFVDTLKSKKIVPQICDYSKIFSDFVGSSCVPGARAKDYGFSVENADKLCEQCIPIVNTAPAKYCNADEVNKYFGSDGALRCLENRAGDYAVITVKDIQAFKDKASSFRVLSKSGSLAQSPGFAVDAASALTIITSGELVIQNTSTKRDDIIQLLRGIEMEFGQSLRKTFKAFDVLNNTANLLFPDSTPGLTFDGSETATYVENFKTLLRNSEKCLTEPSSGTHLIPSTLLMIILLPIVYFKMHIL